MSTLRNRDLIAMVLARRGLMGGASMAGERELREIGQNFGWPAQSLSQGLKDWQYRFERRRIEDENKDPALLTPDQPLYRPDIVPADQPTGEEIPDYLYMKRRL